jgi:Toxin PAAR-like domain
MADTTSNQGKAIVTNGTAHVAQNGGATDPCLDADCTKTVKPFKNNIPSTDLKAHKTTKTLIDEKNIMNSRTEIGPDSMGDDPAWEIGMCSGLPVNNKVWAADFSRDVKAEGFWVVRTDDPTHQNGGNSLGTVDGSNLDGDETTVSEYAKLKCSMKKLEGTSGDRELYKRSARSAQHNYIEILDGETVDFVSTRFDATDVTSKPPLDPACELVPDHTLWEIKRSGAGLDLEDDDSGKEYTLGASMTQFVGSFEASDSYNDNPDGAATEGGITEAGDLRKKTKTTSDNLAVDIGAVIAFIRFWVNPVYVRVKAIACSGSTTAIVRIFPADPMKVSYALSTETNSSVGRGQQRRNALIDSIYDKFGKLKRICSLVGSIVGCADVELHFSMFVGFKIELEVGYKKCTETLTTASGDWRSSQAHVGLAYKLAVGAEKLIEFGVTVTISLLQLVATFVGAGVIVRVVEKIEDVIGVKLELVFSASLAIGFDFEFQSDEHDKRSASGNLRIKPELSIMLRLQLTSAEASAGGRLSGEITISGVRPKPTHFGRITASGKLTGLAWVDGRVKGRVLWVGPEYSIGGRKEFKLFEYPADLGSWDVFEKGKKTA